VTPFRWKKGRLVGEIEAHEAALLLQVVSEIRDVLGETESDDENAANAAPDPVTARLLPAGHRSDPQLARDYRSLTESGLRQEKLADAARLLDTVDEAGGRVELDGDGAEAWIRTLNDVRLAIGVQLDVNEADDPMIRAEETGDPRWAAYSWLTAVQGLLVDALLDKPR